MGNQWGHLGEWPDSANALLRREWANGLTASQISAALERELRIKKSRSAVLGRAHRLGLAGRTRPPQPSGRLRRRKLPMTREQRVLFSPRPIKPEPPPPLADDLKRIAALAPLDGRLSVLRLSTFTCKFPIGDPKHADFAFCGRTVREGAPYCPDHCRLTYVPGSSRERVRARDLERPASAGFSL